jgi:lipopolysaccharide/colanic/teichoic acid biosynthesis glycosyltransferase
MEEKRIRLYVLQLFVDSLLLTVGLVVPAVLLGTLWRPFSGWGALALSLPLYLIFCLYSKAFSIDVLLNSILGIRRSLLALFQTIFIIIIFAFFTQHSKEVSRLTFAFSGITAATLIGLGRLTLSRLIRTLTGGYVIHELLLVDRDGSTATSDGWTVSASDLGLVPDISDPHMLQRFGELTKRFDRVVIDCPSSRRQHWAKMLKGADIDGELLVEQFNDLGAVAIRRFRESDTLVVARRALSVPDRARKRTLDLVITIPTILAAIPILLAAAMAIKLESAGPVFFKQDRIGRANRKFKVLKFRSMYNESVDDAGTLSVSRRDGRVTRVGRFLRRSSVDELPQLINVLLGDMSLVGPRPHALGSRAGEKLFWEVDETYWHRHRLKPGITGLAQVRGFRGSTEHQRDLINRLQADLEYIEGWSIWRDLDVLLKTVRVVVHRNAY